MDKRLLESFVFVCRSESLVEAAERLHISQSALSRRMSELQVRLGVKLFQASGRGIVCTHDAQRLLPLALSALESMSALEDAARKSEAPEPVDLAVAATAHTIMGLVERAAALMRKNPNYVIRFVEAGGVEIEDMVLSGKVSLGLTARPRFDTGLVDLHIARLDLLAASTTPFKASEYEHGIELKKLCEKELIVLDRRYQSRVTLDAAVRLLQLSPKIIQETASAGVAVAMARSGLGTAIIPSSTKVDIPSAQIVANGVALGMDLVAIWDPTVRWRTHVEQLAASLAER